MDSPENTISDVARRIVSFLLPAEVRKGAIQDFELTYAETAAAKSTFHAGLWLWLQILFMLPSALWYKISWSLIMLKNYLKVSLRNIKKNAQYTSVSIIGLSVGFVCAIIIFRFVYEEISVDRFNENADNVYRIIVDETVSSPSGRIFPTAAPPTGPALKDNFSEVEEFCRLRFAENHVLRYQDRSFYEKNFFYADSSFFDVFSFPLTAGNRKTALVKPNTMVLSEKMAQKYFGSENPLGKTLLFDNETELEVTGVIGDTRLRSHIVPEFLISFSTFRVPYGYPTTLEDWRWISFFNYVQLSGNADTAAFAEKMDTFIKSKGDPTRADRFKYRLEPLGDIYFSEIVHKSIQSGNRFYVYALSSVAGILLLIAAFNYTNLTIAKYAEKDREIGVRKAVGASTGNIFSQFLGESVLMAVLSAFISMLSVKFVMIAVNSFFGIRLTFTFTDALNTLFIFLPVSVLLGILSGLYPSLVASKLSPKQLLIPVSDMKPSSFNIRNTIIGAQFILTSVLISANLVILSQMNFLRNMDLGFNKEDIVVLKTPLNDLERDFDTIRGGLLSLTEVKSVTRSSQILEGDNGSVPVYRDLARETEPLRMNIYSVGYDFFETLNIDIEDGRAFSKDYANDITDAVVINRAAADLLGWQEPLGRQIQVSNLVTGTIIGIADNFHIRSLHNSLEPLVLYLPRTQVEYVLLKVQKGRIQDVLYSIQRQWEKLLPDVPFSYLFLDDTIDSLYQNEQLLSRLITLFSFITIFVACLGLYSVVSFISVRKKKEIGIRKVLGAKSMDIIILMTKRFVAVICLAIAVSWLPAHYFISAWLENFAYRVNSFQGAFVLSGLIVVALSIVTILFRALKSASVNPANSLRIE